MYPRHLHYNRPFPDEVCRRLRQGKQYVEIILMKDEIIHDIDADTLNLEKSRKIEETPVATDERRMYEACRQIDRAVDKLVRECSAYLLLPSPYVHRISNNHTKGWEEKSLYLAMPHNWPPHLIDSLRDAAHNHIVRFAEAELLTPILTPTDSYVQYCALAAQDSLNEVQSIISDRYGPIDMTGTPFG